MKSERKQGLLFSIIPMFYHSLLQREAAKPQIEIWYILHKGTFFQDLWEQTPKNTSSYSHRNYAGLSYQQQAIVVAYFMCCSGLLARSAGREQAIQSARAPIPHLQ